MPPRSRFARPLVLVAAVLALAACSTDAPAPADTPAVSDAPAAPDTPAAPSAESGTVEQDTDRAGSDYESFDLAGADYTVCQQACLDGDACRAWTFTPPGMQSDGGMCWLKDAVPEAAPLVGAVSGVVRP